jgi:hypothetical protein
MVAITSIVYFNRRRFDFFPATQDGVSLTNELKNTLSFPSREEFLIGIALENLTRRCYRTFQIHGPYIGRVFFGQTEYH